MSDHPSYSDLLTCPDCGTARAWNTAAACLGCGFVNATPKDWRAVKPLPMKLIAPRVLPEHATEIPGRLEITGPKLTYNGPPAKRNSRQFMSIIQDHLHPGDTVLDLGCGPRDQVVPVEHLQPRYVGLDYDHAGAEMWGDPHSLPFKDQSFDCVVSYAVL